MRRPMELNVNGERRTVTADPSRSLLEVLRDELDLTGTKYGCGEGDCGACTVLIDGQPRRSCVTRVGSVREAEIRTIEGLSSDGRLHPLQRCFLEEGALQCGYCTPGMILTAAGFLSQYPNPSERDIVTHLDGSLCRCGCYPRIVRAIRKASEELRGGGR